MGSDVFTCREFKKPFKPEKILNGIRTFQSEKAFHPTNDPNTTQPVNV